MQRHALRPEQDVAVRQRDPEVVLGQAQQDRVVQDAALGIGDQDVLALPDRHLRQVARGQHLDEGRGIGAGDLDLALDADVAQDRVVDQVPEVLLRVAEVPRDIHVIIHRKPLCAPTHGGVEIGRFPDLRAEAEVVCVHLLRPRLLPDRLAGEQLKLALI